MRLKKLIILAAYFPFIGAFYGCATNGSTASTSEASSNTEKKVLSDASVFSIICGTLLNKDYADYAYAASWCRIAADQGDAYGQTLLGSLYANGQGVPQNYAQAALWYRKAAEQGVDVAQNNLGFLYANGQGVPQDNAQAVLWYRKAAEQGNQTARGNLSALSSKTTRDRVATGLVVGAVAIGAAVILKMLFGGDSANDSRSGTGAEVNAIRDRQSQENDEYFARERDKAEALRRAEQSVADQRAREFINTPSPLSNPGW